MELPVVILVVGIALLGVVVLAVSERRGRHDAHRRTGAAEINREQARAQARVCENHLGGW